MPRHLVLLGLLIVSVTTRAVAMDLTELPAGAARPPTRSDDGVDVEIRHRSAPPSWQARPQLLGDLGGLRTMLAKSGMTLEISGIDEGFADPGDRFTASGDGRYHGVTDVVFSLDTAAAGWWPGGRFVIDLQNTRGGDISDLVGDIQGVSNIVAPPGTRFAEYFLTQELAGGRIGLKVGKQDANADFVVSEGGGEFINSSFGLIPTVPLPTFPSPGLGIMGRWAPSEAIVVKAGYWNGAPPLGSGVSGAIFDGSGGTVGALGIEIHPFRGDKIAGAYRIGVWRHSEVEIVCPSTKHRSLSCPPAKTHAATVTGPSAGLYLTADQGLWEGADRRLSVFVQGGWGEADRSAVSRYLGSGLTCAGPIAGRPDDVVGIGIAYADLGELERHDAGRTSETVIELFYKLPVTGWMVLNPDLQWVRRPAGADGRALVVGLRVATSF